MRLTFNEIRQRAIQFSHDWRAETSERAEAQTFWNEFFNVFGIHRRSVASFERTVRNLEGAYDRIDVIWQGILIGEHKSRGQDLDKAATQALGYVQSLTRAGRDREIPRYIVVSDYARIVLHDLESTDPLFESVSFPVDELHQHVRLFDFLNGIQSRPADPEDPINIIAVEVLGTLHDTLEAGGYDGHKLERLLVRVLFCLFADDTGIFEPDTFKNLVEESHEDGSDLGPQLDRFFKVLDTAEPDRAARLPDALKPLPYVNGNLFAERLDLADFDSDMRNALLAACRLQWAKISPAVFGSLFQSIMAGDEGARRRRQIGAHYTSERDILKLIRSLFLDDLRAEFQRAKARRPDLFRFHEKLAGLKFLDPACGCGNFLVVGYRELRRLEHEVIDSLYPDGLFDISALVRLNVDCMHGIEIEEWPARIAEVAMWLIDHQLNLEASQKFGKPLLRLPLKKSAKIEHNNALRIDWNTVLPASQCSFVMGNPPFVGKQFLTADQEADMEAICSAIRGYGVLDFVTAWYIKGAKYLAGTTSYAAFVSTNSICQGEQATILWPALLAEGLKIAFAHRTFSWMSEARGRAHVHVVIVGFAMVDPPNRKITDYDADEARPVTTDARNIGPYLVDGPDLVISSRTRPICDVPPIVFGSMPNEAKPKRNQLEGRVSPEELEQRLSDQLLLDTPSRDELLAKEPAARKWIRRIYGSEEFINGIDRWCLWMVNITPAELRAMPEVMKRVETVRKNRLESTRETTNGLASTPFLFGEIRQPATKYLLIPSVSSETRPYIPMGFMSPEVIASNLALLVPNATLYHFGILTSTMHMAWVRQVCGRLESRYRYSNKLVYNNFPWPQDVSEKQKSAVEVAAQGVLDARAGFAGQTLADLYDPLAMPKALRDAHKKLDAAVDKCYRPAPFVSERNRVEYLFELYQRLVMPLTAAAKRTRRPRAE